MPMRAGMKKRAPLPAEERRKVSFWIRADFKEYIEKEYGGLTRGLDDIMKRGKFDRVRSPAGKPRGRFELVKATMIITREMADKLRAYGGISGSIDTLVRADMEKEWSVLERPKVPRAPRTPRARKSEGQPSTPAEKAPPPDPQRDLAYLETLPLQPCEECGRWPDHWTHHTKSGDDRGHTYRAET